MNNETHEDRGPFTVYGGTGSRTFDTAEEAYTWARLQHERTGGMYECRDDNFDHVFTVER